MSEPGQVSVRRRESRVLHFWLALLVSLPARLLLSVIWLYRRTLSPVLPVVLGPGCGCRFHPTCAVFAAGAVREHGAMRGSWLAVRRLLKCHPLHPGGFDPVPPVRRRGPICTAVPGFVAPRKENAPALSGLASPVAPVFDRRSRYSKSGAALACGISISRSRKYAD